VFGRAAGRRKRSAAFLLGQNFFPTLQGPLSLNSVALDDRNQAPSSPPEGAPAIVERLVAEAEQARASDIHLQMDGPRATVTFRLDGVMVPRPELPESMAEQVFGRIKFLARLKTYQQALPQDGRIEREAVRCGSEIRVATYPAVSGEKIVLRLFSRGGARSLDELGLSSDVLTELNAFLEKTSGLLLLTGPAGSGKTTTIYACLRRLADMGGRHVITVEDPAEQIVPGIMQTEINEALGLDFARAARHLLRQDPQVLVIGEIRDEETAGIAVRAALTGHLVISTLHAGSCRGVLDRLASLCAERSAVAACLELIVNQRLLRRTCPACKAAGCAQCLATGYSGRLPLVEYVKVTSAVRDQIAAGNYKHLQAVPTLAERAQALVLAGQTTVAEVRRVLGA
jgi:general secretion pathway protein E